ncbi:MAG: hypothetical protein IPK20_17890 [Betaproteobacteria bacterium]|nr:hypothetical protein [Betaproteobacteria bacterium]
MSENAAGQERISPMPTTPTIAMLKAMGTRNSAEGEHHGETRPTQTSSPPTGGRWKVSGRRRRADHQVEVHHRRQQQHRGRGVLEAIERQPELGGGIAILGGASGAAVDQPRRADEHGDAEAFAMRAAGS